MTDSSLEKAINHIKAGEFDQGGKILISLLKEDLTLEDAWWWLRYCVQTDDQQIYCINKVLALNPEHEGAKAALENLSRKQISGQSVQVDLPPTQKQDVPEQIKAQKSKKNKKVAKSNENEKSPKESIQEQTEVSNLGWIKIKLAKPKVIFNQPDDNLFAKERFALNNWPDIDGAMYGNRLIIGGISITAYDYPRCIEAGQILNKSQCYICEFFSVSDCPIRRDSTILREARTLFSQRKRYRQEYQERRDAIVDAIYSELKDHGRPLHYRVLAKIIHDRYPRLKLRPGGVLKIMSRHPGKFEWVDKGVYRAR